MCARVRRFTPWSVAEDNIEVVSGLDELAERAQGDGMRCAWTKVEARDVLVCSDGEWFLVAYRVKCPGER